MSARNGTNRQNEADRVYTLRPHDSERKGISSPMTLPCIANPEMWYDGTKANLAARECRACPMLDACRIAGKDEEYGVWGGTTPEDREPRLRELAGIAREADRQERTVTVRALRAEGHSVRTIAGLTGYPKSSVADILKAA